MVGEKKTFCLAIEDLTQEGEGVGRLDGKTVFVPGALPQEEVEVEVTLRRPRFDVAHIVRLIKRNPARVEPFCPHFGECGGCVLMHAALPLQAALKSRILEDTLLHLGRISPEIVLPPIAGPAWGYRHRARLSVRWIRKKEQAAVGFRDRSGRKVVLAQRCPVLASSGSLLQPLSALVAELSVREALPQIEVVAAENALVLNARILSALTAGDEALLRRFADTHGVYWWLQPKGPETAFAFYPPSPPLFYTLPEFGVEIFFSPLHFTQVNFAVNRILARRAVSLLEPQKGERIADLFCGIGNFSLPLARARARVLGVEGEKSAVEQARKNAVANGLLGQAEFLCEDLAFPSSDLLARVARMDKILLDPPRTGAKSLLEQAELRASRLVYVSCNPATLARDAAILAEKGYFLKAIQGVNLFPHTAHLEALALFLPQKKAFSPSLFLR